MSAPRTLAPEKVVRPRQACVSRMQRDIQGMGDELAGMASSVTEITASIAQRDVCVRRLNDRLDGRAAKEDADGIS